MCLPVNKVCSQDNFPSENVSRGKLCEKHESEVRCDVPPRKTTFLATSSFWGKMTSLKKTAKSFLVKIFGRDLLQP